jgi:predicted solute-binding protein
MNELKLSKENVIVRIDTVFIETKKNFWGKEKTSINVTSETKSTEIIDSVLSEKKVIDTLNHQK